MSQTPALASGQIFAGVYELIRRAVPTESRGRWIARDNVSGEHVELWFVPLDVARQESAVMELMRDVAKARCLIHPGIQRGFELIAEGNVVALRTERLAGTSLGDCLARSETRCFEPSAVTELLAQAAATLEETHEIGLFHGAISPENLVLQPAGQVVCTGFGYQRTIDAALAFRARPNAIRADAYLSPQLLEGAAPSCSDDIYALGATIYELLTGRPPFEGEDVLKKIVTDTPVPVSLQREISAAGAGGLPHSWDEVIAACLSKDPHKRPLTVRELRSQLGLGDPFEAVPSANPRSPSPTTAKREACRQGGEPQYGTGSPQRSTHVGMGQEWTRTQHAARSGSQSKSPSISNGKPAQRSGGGSRRFFLAGMGILVACYSLTRISPDWRDEFTAVGQDSQQTKPAGIAAQRESNGRVVQLDSAVADLPRPHQAAARTREVVTVSNALLVKGGAQGRAGVGHGQPMPMTALSVTRSDSGPTPSGASQTASRPSDVGARPVAPAEAEEPARLKNSLGMEFVPVEAGFSFCIWPTRVRDFELFAAETKLQSTSWKVPGFRQTVDHPVVNVTWQQAVDFCKWLTERDRKLGLLGVGEVYRLPTDQEWSRVVGLSKEEGSTPEARDMGNRDAFPWGTEWPPPAGSGNYAGEETQSIAAIKGYEDAFVWTSPVGSFAPNAHGIYDMGGNVWQWCADNWDGQSSRKFLRGASWSSGAPRIGLLASCRIPAEPDTMKEDFGFRVVRAADPLRTTKR